MGKTGGAGGEGGLSSQDLHVAGSINFKLAQSAMDSIMDHLWYLTEDTVIFGLFDPGLSEE